MSAGFFHRLDVLIDRHGSFLKKNFGIQLLMRRVESFFREPFIFAPLGYFLWAQQQETHPFQEYFLLTTILHKTNYVLLSFKDKQIDSVRDLHGKTIGIYDSYQTFLMNNTLFYILEQQGIQPKAIEMYQGYDYNIIEMMLFFDKYDVVLVHGYEIYSNFWLLHNGLTTYYQPTELNYIFLDDLLPNSSPYTVGLFLHKEAYLNFTSIIQQQSNMLMYSILFCAQYPSECIADFKGLSLYSFNQRLYNNQVPFGNFSLSTLESAVYWSNQMNITQNFTPSNLTEFIIPNWNNFINNITTFIFEQNSSMKLVIPWYESPPLCNASLGTWNYDLCAGAPQPFAIFFLIQSIISLACIPVSLALILLICLNIKKQPTKSRFISPFVANIMLMVLNLIIGLACLFTTLRYSVPRWMTVVLKMNPEFFAQSIAETFILVAFGYGTIFITYSIQTIRYFYIKSFYNNLLNRSKIMSSSFAKFNRYLTSNVAYIVIIVALFILYGLIILPFLIFGNNVRETVVENIAGLILALSIIVIFIVITCFAFSIDILLKAKELFVKCKWVWFFFVDDPLLFRFESFLLIPTIAVGWIAVLIFALDSGIGHMYTMILTLLFFNLFNFLLLLVFGGGFLLLAQCITTLSSKKRFQIFSNIMQHLDDSNTSFIINSEIEDILKDINGHKLLAKYAANEFSLENILFYDELESIVFELQKMQINFESLKQQFAMLNDKFIAKNSIYEVNISHEGKKFLDEAIESLQQAVLNHNLANQDRNSKNLNSLTPGVESPSQMIEVNSDIKQDRHLSKNQIIETIRKAVVQLKKEVIVNIADTLSRLQGTFEYKLYIKLVTTNKQMLKNANISL